MKAHINNTAPNLVTYIELNQRHGVGYQARMVMSDADGVMIESVLDTEPFTLDEAVAGTIAAIEEINTAQGYDYKPEQVIRIVQDGIDANKSREFSTAKLARDIETGTFELCHENKPDVMHKEELVFTGRGTVLCTYFAWLDDELPKALEAMKRYCQYLALHGYGKGASDIWAELEALDKDAGADWIRLTYGCYVHDDAALISFIMPNI